MADEAHIVYGQDLYKEILTISVVTKDWHLHQLGMKTTNHRTEFSDVLSCHVLRCHFIQN